MYPLHIYNVKEDLVQISLIRNESSQETNRSHKIHIYLSSADSLHTAVSTISYQEFRTAKDPVCVPLPANRPRHLYGQQFYALLFSSSSKLFSIISKQWRRILYPIRRVARNLHTCVLDANKKCRGEVLIVETTEKRLCLKRSSVSINKPVVVVLSQTFAATTPK